MRYQLVCCDIDGTLLDKNKELVPQVKQAVLDMVRMGVRFALVSGRLPAGVEVVERGLGIPCIKICNAGTYIITEDRCVSSVCFSTNTMKRIDKEIAQKNQVLLWIFREREWYVTGIDFFIEREIGFVLYQPKVVQIESLAEQWIREQTGPNKMLIAAEPKKIQKIYQQIKELNLPDIDIAYSSEEFIEIFPKGINKGTALAAICKRWKIPLENTVAIGDQELDLPMIEAAGLGIAMGNAIDQVKEKADIVTKTNNEAGVAYAIEHYIMG